MAKLGLLLACCILLGACGEVTPKSDASTTSDALTSDAQADIVDATPIDAPTPDAMGCQLASECDNGVFCDGVEICGPGGQCLDAVDPDCGVSDVCNSRFCDTAGDQCATTQNTLTFNWTFSDGANGGLAMTCGTTMTAGTGQGFCPTGAPTTLLLQCMVSAAGQLTAFVQSTTGCLPPATGQPVAAGCSTAQVVTGGVLDCCWP